MAASSPDERAAVVLVVEDETLIRLCSVLALLDEGFAVLEAAHAHEAIDILEVQFADIHVVFTDVHMPGTMNGVGLAHHATQHWPSIAVIVTSAHPLHALDPLPAGARYLPKPYAIEDVARQVRELVVG